MVSTRANPVLVATTQTTGGGGQATYSAQVLSPSGAAGQTLYMIVCATANSGVITNINPNSSQWTAVTGLIQNNTGTVGMATQVFRRTSTVVDTGLTYPVPITASSSGMSYAVRTVSFTGLLSSSAVALASQEATIGNTVTIPEGAGTATQVLSIIGGRGETSSAGGGIVWTPVDTDLVNNFNNSFEGTTNGYYNASLNVGLHRDTDGNTYTASRNNRRVVGQIRLLGVEAASHPGGRIAGAGSMSSQGERIIPVRHTSSSFTVGSATSVPVHPIPATLVGGDRMFFLLTAAATTVVINVDPPGWTRLADWAFTTIYTGHAWLYTRTYDPGIGNTNITPTYSSSNAGGTWAGTLIVYAGNGVKIRGGVGSAVQTQSSYAAGTVITSPAATLVPGAKDHDTVLSFVAGAVINNTASTSLPAPESSVGRDQVVSTSNGITNQIALSMLNNTSAGVQQSWKALVVTQPRQFGAIALYDESIYIPPRFVTGQAGRITGYARTKITKATGAHKGKTPPVVGYAKITSKGKRDVKTGRGGRLTGYGRLKGGPGYIKGRRPIERPGASSSASDDAARYLRLLIPKITKVGDYIVITVGILGTARPQTPAGWTVLSPTTTVASGVTSTVYGRTAGVYEPGSTVVIATDATRDTPMVGALAAYKSAGLISNDTYVQSTGTLRVKVGPTNRYDAGNQRVGAGTATPTSLDGQLRFSTPAAYVPGLETEPIQPATVNSQISGGTSPTLGVYLVDYDAATNLQGQFNAVTPALARTTLIELIGELHHEGTIAGKGVMHAGPGIKFDPPGRFTASGQIIVPARFAHGAHTTGKPLVWMNPRVNPFWTVEIRPGPGLKYDSYHGGRINSGDPKALHGEGTGAHTSTGKTIRGYGAFHPDIHWEHAGGDFVAEATMHGEGERTYAHPGGTITGYARLRDLSGPTHVNYLTGYALITSEVGFGAHAGQGDPIIGTPKGVVGRAEAVMHGEGTAYFRLDERYTQIRGYVRLYVRAGEDGPARIPEGTGQIDAIGIISTEYLGLRNLIDAVGDLSNVVPAIIGVGELSSVRPTVRNQIDAVGDLTNVVPAITAIGELSSVKPKSRNQIDAVGDLSNIVPAIIGIGELSNSYLGLRNLIDAVGDLTTVVPAIIGIGELSSIRPSSRNQIAAVGDLSNIVPAIIGIGELSHHYLGPLNVIAADGVLTAWDLRAPEIGDLPLPVELDEPQAQFTAVVVLDDGIAVAVQAGTEVHLNYLFTRRIYRNVVRYGVVMRPTNVGHTS